jgi:hypothetical protein
LRLKGDVTVRPGKCCHVTKFEIGRLVGFLIYVAQLSKTKGVIFVTDYNLTYGAVPQHRSDTVITGETWRERGNKVGRLADINSRSLTMLFYTQSLNAFPTRYGNSTNWASRSVSRLDVWLLAALLHRTTSAPAQVDGRHL